MKFRLVEDNELEKRAKYHKKRQKGLSPFYSPDGGNVPLAIDRFNNSVADGANGLMEDYEEYYERVTDSESDWAMKHDVKRVPNLYTKEYGQVRNVYQANDGRLFYIYDGHYFGTFPEYCFNGSNESLKEDFEFLDSDPKDVDYKVFKDAVETFIGDYKNVQAEDDPDTMYDSQRAFYKKYRPFVNKCKSLINSINPTGYGVNDYYIIKIRDLCRVVDNNFPYGWKPRNYTDESLNEDRHNPLKAVVLHAIDFLWDAGFPHPENWIDDNWNNLKIAVESGIDDVDEVAQNLKSYIKSYLDDENSVLDIEGEDANYDLIPILEDFYYDLTKYMETSECLKEDTVKNSDGTWSNKGDEGSHGKFRTKKQADNQRKAMFANGYKEDWNVKYHNDLDSKFGYDPGPGYLLVDHPKAYPMDKSTAKSIARNLSKNSPEFMSYWAEEDTDDEDMYESLNESIDIDEAQLEKELYDLLLKNNLYPEDMSVHDGEITIYISHGDWKHEHLRCKWLVNDFLEDNGFEDVDYYENLTDDDGSDTYSAEHHWIIYDNNDLSVKELPLQEAKYFGYNYPFEVHWIQLSGKDVLLGASANIDSAEDTARSQINQLLKNSSYSAKEKYKIIDSLYIYNAEDDMAWMPIQLEKFVANTLRNLHKQIGTKTESLLTDIHDARMNIIKTYGKEADKALTSYFKEYPKSNVYFSEDEFNKFIDWANSNGFNLKEQK